MDYKETSEELLRWVDEARALLPDIHAAYDALARVLTTVLRQGTEHAGVRLVGPFAKMDYLLREHDAAPRLSRRAQGARTRMRRRAELPDETLREAFEVDATAIAEFIRVCFDLDVPEAEAEDSHDDDAGHTPQESLRLLVSHWDNDYAYGHTDDDPTTLLRVSFLATGSNFDWTYLAPLLYEGAQLSLVRPTQEADGTVRAELLILEPDLLVDISAVAHCFESYDESARVYLLDLIRPRQTTEHIIMGNLAGQMLDEVLHHGHTPIVYADTIKTFFQQHALQMLTTPIPDDFHARAQEQLTHIREAVETALPGAVKGFDVKNVMVEPSFFCPLLGLQGRMDMLQLDGRLLIEQKAGKGGWPPQTDGSPTAAEPHYVQMLLYMALLRYQYGISGRTLQAFLLYSKYPESLLGLGYAPELVHRALRVRNSIAWLMRHLSRGGSTILERLTPERLNTKNDAGPLWLRYKRPELEALLAPIQTASPLERAYFHRMVRFLATEHLLAKLGNKTKESAGFASKWHEALGEKLQAGNIICPLTLDASFPNGEPLETLTFALPEEEETGAALNFRQGDIVVVYAYPKGHEPDLRRTLVFRATIETLKAETITLRLRAPQTDPHVFLRHKDRPWAIEHDLMESSFGSLYRGLYAFLSAPRARRDLILLQREPEVDTSRKLRGDYGAFNDLALRVKQAKDLFLIIGPPGTGKTSFGLMTTLKEELLEPASQVLLLSYTNRAVDEICSKLVEAGLDFLRIGSETSCEEAYRPYLLRSRLTEVSRLDDLRRVVLEARIVVGTTTALTSSADIFQLKTFSLTLIDEASQILEPHLMAILSQEAVEKVVMIGDHKQLPAVVQQEAEAAFVDDPLLREIGLTDCRHSLFERLLSRYRHRAATTYMLTKQGRMHTAIAQFPSAEFYEGRLRVAGLPHQEQKDAAGDLPRTLFVDVPKPETSASDKVNLAEAEVIARFVERIYNKEREGFDAQRTVGIIVPYRNQIAAIRRTLAHLHIAALDGLTIDTVERFQGSQRRYIIYGFTVQHRYQLAFLTSHVFEEDGHRIDRKLNVAMTRAQEHLIVVGNKSLICEDPTFQKMVEAFTWNGEF